MQLTRESSGDHLIRALRDGAVRIGERWYASDLIVAAEGIHEWTAARTAGQGIETLRLEQLAPAVALEPEILLLGTGARAIFPPLALHAELARLRIGLEVMSTAAACRTYNVLAAEQRHVVAALLLGAEPAPGPEV